MMESGYSLEAQLGLDDAWIAWVEEFERLRDEMVMVDAEEPDRNAKPQVPAPKYDSDQLKEWLEIPAEGVGSALAMEASQPPTKRDWDAVPWE